MYTSMSQQKAGWYSALDEIRHVHQYNPYKLTRETPRAAETLLAFLALPDRHRTRLSYASFKIVYNCNTSRVYMYTYYATET